MNLPSLAKIIKSRLDIPGWVEPRLNKNWRSLPDSGLIGDLMNYKGHGYFNVAIALKVFVSLDELNDGSNWLHIHCISPVDHLLTGSDIEEIKNIFIGDDREAIQVFTSDMKIGHVHLWAIEAQG